MGLGFAGGLYGLKLVKDVSWTQLKQSTLGQHYNRLLPFLPLKKISSALSQDCCFLQPDSQQLYAVIGLRSILGLRWLKQLVKQLQKDIERHAELLKTQLIKKC